MEEIKLSSGHIAVSSDTSAKIYDSSKSNCIVEYDSTGYRSRTGRPRGVITIHNEDEFKQYQDVFERYFTSLPWSTIDRFPIKKYPGRSIRGSLRKKHKQKKKTKRKKHKQKKKTKRKKTKRKKTKRKKY